MADSAAPSIQLDRRGAVASIRLSRPATLNALDPDSVRLLLSTLQEVGHDRAIRAVIITGEGTAFSSGGDIAAMRAHMKVGISPGCSPN